MTENKYKRITISFTDADSDLVKYIDDLKKSGRASEFIREAIREKIKKGSTVVNEDLVRNIIKDLLPSLIPQIQPNIEVNKVSEYLNVSGDLKEVKEESIDEAVLDAIDSFDF